MSKRCTEHMVDYGPDRFAPHAYCPYCRIEELEEQLEFAVGWLRMNTSLSAEEIMEDILIGVKEEGE